MNNLVTITAALSAVLLAWLGTGLVRRHALRRSLLDIPNHRSSHTVPTPRGGGLSIVFVVLFAAGLGWWSGQVSSAHALAWLGGGGLIAFVGWVDDRRGLSALLRALAHFAAAALAVYTIGTPSQLNVGGATYELGALYAVVAVLALVWLINLFNFMDGIDGIAAGEAATVAAAAAGFLIAAGDRSSAALAIIVCAACIGFLIWNWPPAKIFMGDVGSGFLGFALGTLALGSISSGTISLPIWILLLAVFLFDATVTLLRRLGKEPFYEAHRRHAYQRAVQSGSSHVQVTLSVVGLNAVLAGLGVIAWLYPQRVPAVMLCALALVGGIYLYIEHRRPMWTSRTEANLRRG